MIFAFQSEKEAAIQASFKKHVENTTRLKFDFLAEIQPGFKVIFKNLSNVQRPVEIF